MASGSIKRLWTWHYITWGAKTQPAANTWSRVPDVSITVPTKNIYVGYLHSGWNNGKPQGIGCDTLTSIAAGQSPVFSAFQSEGTQYTLPVVLTPGTYYVYTYRGSAAANSYSFSYLNFVV